MPKLTKLTNSTKSNVDCRATAVCYAEASLITTADPLRQL